MDDAQAQLTDRLKTANNILVTVSRNPSVDQLAACIGLTLVLNKQGKHAAAVFSGKVPSTLEFLKPEETLERNTDSLRDFIIALDKNKADKLRYKVEDDVVRIFITPYKTSINQNDLDFSQGDFNVDVVVALGVKQQEDLDEAIIAHGRILHDATVASINIDTGGDLGTINWQAPQASSLSELVTHLAQQLGENLLDEQIATALLTGVVAETDRFSNDKTSPQTMSAGAALMSAGANQQLVASKLEEGEPKPATSPKSSDGAIAIEHKEPPAEAPSGLPVPEIKPETLVPAPDGVSQGPKIITEPPTLGGALTANSKPEPLEPSTDPLSMPNEEPPQLLERKQTANATGPPTGAPALPVPPADPNATLSELEESVNSAHAVTEHLDEARDEVSKALSTNAPSTSPIQALNAQPLGDSLNAPAPAQPQVADPSAPPPVPPPIPFQFGNPPPQQ